MEEDQSKARLLRTAEVMTRLAQATNHLPSPKGVCLAVLQTVQNQEASLEDLRTLIEADMSLSGRVLKVANSALFGSRTRVTSVGRAIQMLGFGMVKTLALSAFLHETMGTVLPSRLPYGDLPRYVILTNTLSGAIARKVSPSLADDCETIGLIHECGVLVMAEAMGQEYTNMLGTLASSGMSLAELEFQHFGVTHAQAGRIQLSRWRLPEAVIQAVEHHHDASWVGDSPTATLYWKVLRVAGELSLLICGQRECQGAVKSLGQELLGWDWHQVVDLATVNMSEYRKKAEILRGNLTASPDSPEVITEELRKLRSQARHLLQLDE